MFGHGTPRVFWRARFDGFQNALMKRERLYRAFVTLQKSIATGSEDFDEHLGESNERAIVSCLGNRRMELDVRGRAIPAMLHLVFLLLQYGFQLLDVFRSCSIRRERGNGWIEEHARFEDIPQCGLRHRLSQALGVTLGNESARTGTADHERLKLHNSQGLANGRATDLHSFREFAFGWKLIARLEFSPTNICGELHHDLFMKPRFLYFSQRRSHAATKFEPRRILWFSGLTTD